MLVRCVHFMYKSLAPHTIYIYIYIWPPKSVFELIEKEKTSRAECCPSKQVDLHGNVHNTGIPLQDESAVIMSHLLYIDPSNKSMK